MERQTRPTRSTPGTSLYGALVGGPTVADDAYTDSRCDYLMNEVATDYNAGVHLRAGPAVPASTAARRWPTSRPRRPRTAPRCTSRPRSTRPAPDFTEIKAMVYNKSAWPARALTNGSFRYYFTLDAGYAASQVTP